MEEKKLKKIWLMSIFILLIAFSMYLLYVNKDDENINNSSNKEKYELVKNYNNFYTVNSCVSRYINYLNTKNTSALLNVLDDAYISANNINSDNIYNYINLYDANNFKSLKMYKEKINFNITKYYVYGYAEKDVMDSFPEHKDAYFIVLLDEKEGIFTIQPYSGDIFK